MRTLVAGCCLQISCVAASPSITGMRMSINTTLGRSLLTAATASRPSRASPTAIIDGSLSINSRNEARTKS